MASEVSICNQALSGIGSKSSIASLDEESAPAKQCKLHYASSRDALLENFDWGFSTRTIDLASVGTPPPDWMYQYAYPNNCLKAIEIVRASRNYPVIPFRIGYDPTLAAKVVLTDQETAELRYVEAVTDPNRFTESFRNALAALLAYRIAMPITRNLKIKQSALDDYRLAINAARVQSLNEGQDDKQADIPEASWLNARD